MAFRDISPPARAPNAPAPILFQFGDLNCPLCGEPLDIITQQTAEGAEQAGLCAACMTIVEV